ncbi:MAG: hypothetical protein KDM63_12910 [Verrucomicrobiae bacterium]|nr:hypothetical protein [Verrucomicrobiae bacterium]MCB1087943.1 hypothetical protein [Verrucomicrobiae bacterium]
MMDLEEIATQAALLDEESRASLACQLLRSLTPPVHDVSDEEVSRRLREAESDPDCLINHEEFLAGIEHRGS